MLTHYRADEHLCTNGGCRVRPLYTPSDATCQRGERHGRLLVRFHAYNTAVWRDLHADFKAHVPRHGDACYLPTSRSWSVAAHRRREVEEWIARTFERSAVTWHPDAQDDDETGEIA